MWNWDQFILGDNERLEQMIHFALEAGINEISLSINWNGPFEENPNHLSSLRNTLARLSANDITVGAPHRKRELAV